MDLFTKTRRMSFFPVLKYVLFAIVVVWVGRVEAQTLCQQLETELRRVDASGGMSGQYSDAIAQQQYEINRLVQHGQNLACNDNVVSTDCEKISAYLKQMRENLSLLQRQANLQTSAYQQQRNQIIQSLNANGCRGNSAGGTVTNQQRSLIDILFGDADQQSAVPQDQLLQNQYYSGRELYRTVCVRSCDGFFFPISYATTEANFERDQASCYSRCPDISVDLFTFRTEYETIEDAISLSGLSYKDLPNANRYKKQLVSGCTCTGGERSSLQASLQALVEKQKEQVFQNEGQPPPPPLDERGLPEFNDDSVVRVGPRFFADEGDTR